MWRLSGILTNTLLGLTLHSFISFIMGSPKWVSSVERQIKLAITCLPCWKDNTYFWRFDSKSLNVSPAESQFTLNIRLKNRHKSLFWPDSHILTRDGDKVLFKSDNLQIHISSLQLCDIFSSVINNASAVCGTQGVQRIILLYKWRQHSKLFTATRLKES